MISVEAIVGLGMVVWYFTWTITLFRNTRKQTKLLKKIAGEK